MDGFEVILIRAAGVSPLIERAEEACDPRGALLVRDGVVVDEVAEASGSFTLRDGIGYRPGESSVELGKSKNRPPLRGVSDPR